MDLLRICKSGNVQASVESMSAQLSRIEANLDLDNEPPNRHWTW